MFCIFEALVREFMLYISTAVFNFTSQSISTVALTENYFPFAKWNKILKLKKDQINVTLWKFYIELLFKNKYK